MCILRPIRTPSTLDFHPARLFHLCSWKNFHPACLFHPARLLNFSKISTLLFYSILESICLAYILGNNFQVTYHILIHQNFIIFRSFCKILNTKWRVGRHWIFAGQLQSSLVGLWCLYDQTQIYFTRISKGFPHTI